jgi:uncharacterized protein YraI
MKIILGTFMVCALTVAASPASATIYCGLKKTADGFVSLRTGPSADAPLILKMKPGDEVQIDQGEQNGWIKVIWWRGDDRLSKRYGGAGRQGWMNRALHDDMCG